MTCPPERSYWLRSAVATNASASLSVLNVGIVFFIVVLTFTLGYLQLRQLGDFERFGAVADLGEVVIHLQAKPRIGIAAYRQFEAHGHFGSDAGTSGNEIVKLLPRDANRLGGCADRNPDLIDFVANHFAGVRRILHRHGVSLL